MRNNVTTVLIICLAISTLIFAFLWNAEKNSKDDVKELAQASAVDAYTQFAIYQSHGDIIRYWDGVASFHSFQQAYLSIVQGTNQSCNSLICNEIYGYMIAEPEKCQNFIADIVSIMELLSKDVEDLTGHDQLFNLRNALR